MLKISKPMTGIEEADKYIAGLIEERIINLVSLQIANCKSEPNEKSKNMLLNALFPYEYPEKMRQKKLEVIREVLVSREKDYLDPVGKYVLFNMITIYAIVIEEYQGTSSIPFLHRDYIEEILFEKYGTLKDRLKFISYYEDYDHYVSIIFDNTIFLDIEDFSQEDLLKMDVNSLNE